MTGLRVSGTVGRGRRDGTAGISAGVLAAAADVPAHAAGEGEWLLAATTSVTAAAAS